MKNLCIVVSSPLTIKSFLFDHIKSLSSIASITVISNFSQKYDIEGLPFQTICYSVKIKRKIDLISDLAAFFNIYAIFKKKRYDLVYSLTPKAGLLAMSAAKYCNINARIHSFTGQVWATKRGCFRKMLKAFDKYIYYCASEVLVDSLSQRDYLIKEKIITKQRSSVLGDGSICGVDTFKFKPDAEARRDIRKQLNIPQESIVFIFMGRIYKEKGIVELVDAFSSLQKINNNTRLLIVGPDEDKLLLHIVQKDGVIKHGYTETPQKYFAASDVLCIPSHREGFGSVIIEAAACGIPAIGSNIYGIKDAIEDGKTGLLHQVRNARDILRCMNILLTDRPLLYVMGQNAMIRAKTIFSKERVVAELTQYIRKIIDS